MKKKVIWYCTGCDERCAVKITGGYDIPRSYCLLFSEVFLKPSGYKPDWHKYEPQKREPEVKAPF